DARGERGQPGSDPRGVSPLGRQHGAVGGQFGPPVRAVGLYAGALFKLVRALGEVCLSLRRRPFDARHAVSNARRAIWCQGAAAKDRRRALESIGRTNTRATTGKPAATWPSICATSRSTSRALIAS